MEHQATAKNIIQEKDLTTDQVHQVYQSMKNEYSNILQKLQELEQAKSEHMLVISSIEPLEGTRRCYRLVGGVLVERTVADVLPAVKANLDTIEILLKQLNMQLDQAEEEINKFAIRHKLVGTQETETGNQ